jgi:flagellin
MAVINTNVASLNAQNNLMKSQNDLQTSLQRLSSGLRINSAKDDAAGLAISDRMTSQIRGLNQAQRNANDGISLAQTAEGAMQESTNILQRMRELSVQSANDTNSASDRASLQKEVNQLQQELERIATTSSFNGKTLLDGGFVAQSFQIGANANQTIDISIASARTKDMGNFQVSANGTVSAQTAAAYTVALGNGFTAQTLSVNGAFGKVDDIEIKANQSAKDIAEAINARTEETGVTANASTYALIDGLAGTGSVSFALKGSNSEAIEVSANVDASTNDLSELAKAINDASGSTGITATLTSDKSGIVLESSTGEDIKVLGADLGDATTLNITRLGSTDSTDTIGAGANIDGNDATVAGIVKFDSNKSFTASSTEADNIFVGALKSELKTVDGIDIGSQSGANNAISIIDGALAQIADSRADLGAVMNRFESTIANLASISENVSAARSRIQDADFAQETANLTRNQILQQAGTTILAQANQLPQSVLSLLG